MLIIAPSKSNVGHEAAALGMTVGIIDPGLQDLAPLKRLTP